MTVATKYLHNAYVLYDSEHPNRWYDAWGEGVIKYLQEFIGIPTDDATGMPTEFTNTLVGASTFGIADVAGGAALLTAAGADNDGVKLQLGSELGTAGENVDLSGPYPLYFGIRFAVNDADQTDVLFGVSMTDTTCLDGADTAMYFRSVDESALLYFVTEKNTIEGATAVATLQDGVAIVAEFLFDGATVYSYINGTLTSSTARTDATFPNDELMRLTLEFLAGVAAANTCTINWVRMIHIR